MEYVISAVFSLLEMLFLWMFLSAFLPVKQTRAMFIAATFAACAAIIPLTLLKIPASYKNILSIAMNIGLALWLFGGPWYWHIVLVLVGFIFGTVFDAVFLYATTWILGISLEALVWKKVLYVVVTISAKLTAIFLARLLVQIKQPGSLYGKQFRWILLTILFPLVSLVMLLFVIHTSRDAPDLSSGAAVFSGLIAVANVAILYILTALKKAAHEEQKTALMHQQVAIQTESIISLEKSYHAQRMQSHEYRNQLQVIHGLLLDGNVEEAERYVNHLCQNSSSRIFSIRSNHPIIDAILSQKYFAAKEADIDFHVTINDLSGMTLRTESLVVLLTNLLDNAIEACCRLENNRVIQFRMLCEDTLYLSVRNTSPPVEIKNNLIPTSKFPKEDHGFGLPQIKNVLKMLNAEYSFQYVSGWFEFVADIPLP